MVNKGNGKGKHRGDPYFGPFPQDNNACLYSWDRAAIKKLTESHEHEGVTASCRPRGGVMELSFHGFVSAETFMKAKALADERIAKNVEEKIIKSGYT